eukprot:sb/3466973/
MILVFCSVLLLATAKSTLLDEFKELERRYFPQNGLLTAHPEVRKQRFLAFKRSKNDVNDINSDLGNTYVATTNKFSLMSEAERHSYTGLNISLQSGKEERLLSEQALQFDVEDLPDSVDYSGNLPPVKDQGRCGACWAFTLAATFEGEYHRVTGETVSFSDQELLDCGSTYSTSDGCQGGFFTKTFKNVKDSGRLALEKDVPYLGHWKQYRCRIYLDKPNGMTKAKLFKAGPLDKTDEGLQKAAAITTVAVGIKIVRGFHEYKSGVFNPSFWIDLCEHAVTVVGYGQLGNTESGLYWKVSIKLLSPDADVFKFN